MSQEQLAHEVGTSQRQISKYENEKNDPTAHVLNSLADALDTTADYLLGRTDIRERPLRNTSDLSPNERALIRALRQGEQLEAIRIISTPVKEGY
jgi:transcriptional regulator with XRE-family HTH domain